MQIVAVHFWLILLLKLYNGMQSEDSTACDLHQFLKTSILDHDDI